MTDKILKEIICQRIIALRTKSGLKQEQLALQSSISKGGLNEIERCLKEPKINTIAKLCATFGIRMSDFF